VKQALQRGKKAVRLAKLAGDHGRALGALDDAEQALRRAEHEAEKVRDSAALAVGTGEIEQAQYETRVAAADESVATARKRVEQQRRVVAAVANAAADLSEELAAEKIEKAERAKRTADATLAEAERVLANARAERDAAYRDCDLIVHANAFPRAPYDSQHEERREEREHSEARLVRDFARKWPESYQRRAHVALHDRIAAEIEKLRGEREERQKRDRERAAPQRREDSLAPGEEFERVERLEVGGWPIRRT